MRCMCLMLVVFCLESWTNLLSCCSPQDVSSRPWEGCYTICASLLGGNSYRYVIFPDSDTNREYVFDGPLDVNFLKRTLSLHENITILEHYSLFNTSGTILTKLPVNEPVLFFSGGRFQWPPVAIGYKRIITLPKKSSFLFTTNMEIELETLSVSPVVLSIKQFLTLDECEHIRSRAGPAMQPSTVKHHDSDRSSPSDKWRSSSNEFLKSKHDKTLQSLDEKISNLLKLPINHQEQLQLLKYDIGGKYDSHHDFFDLQYYQSNPDMLNLIQNGANNRIATVLWYLNDVEEGGETVFPRFDHAPNPNTYKDCTKGLIVKPELGKVLLFYNLKPSGALDEYSLHGACKVIKGEKWAANKWIWKEPFRDAEVF